MFLLDRIELWGDKEDYDMIFNEFKTAFCKKHKGNWTDKQIKESLENELEIAFDFKDYRNIWDKDLVLFIRMWICLYESRGN